MNELLSSLFDSNMKAEPSDKEYVGEDGLFYCKKCHTPTQCRMEIAGRQSIVSCMCKCAKEELDKYERELAEMNRRNHIYSLKANGIQERALYDWTFEKAADSPSIQMARRYVDSWPEVKKTTSVSCSGAMLEQENHLQPPVLPTPCWRPGCRC